MELPHHDITEQIIGAAFEVHRILGYGFLEKVYQHAMAIELRLRGLAVELESKIEVWYKTVRVGSFEADLFVNQCVIAELKVAKEYQKADEAQLLNELKATGIKVGLLINFGAPKLYVKKYLMSEPPSTVSAMVPNLWGFLF